MCQAFVSIVNRSLSNVKSSPVGDWEVKHVGYTERDFLIFLFLRFLADLEVDDEVDLLLVAESGGFCTVDGSLTVWRIFFGSMVISLREDARGSRLNDCVRLPWAGRTIVACGI